MHRSPPSFHRLQLDLGGYFVYSVDACSLSTSEGLYVVGGGLPALAVCLCVAVAAALLFSPATTWVYLVCRGVLMALVLLAVTVLLTPFARDKVAQAAMFLSSWRGNES